MSVSKLTIVAQLRDELTVPLRKVIKGLDEAADAAAKGAVSADRQADAFNRLAKEAGWATNRAGKWVDASNRVVSRSDRARMGIDALSLATHEAAQATKLQEQAFKDVVKAAGYKIASDGSVRNALGLFVKQQTVATMRTMAATQATRHATTANHDAMGQAADLARHTAALNEVFKENVEALKYTYNSQGQLTTSTGRLISATELGRMRAHAASEATYRMGMAAAEAAGKTARAGEDVHEFSRNALLAGNAVDTFARRMGMSDTAARRMGVALGDAIDSGAVADGVASFKAKLDSIHEHSKGVADKIKSTMGTALKAGGLATLGATGYAIHGGMQRLNALEQADVKLEVQDFSEQDRDAIKNEVDQMVRGTTLTLPQALDTAQGLLGSGVEYGPEFTEYMGTMVDAQSIYSAHDPKQLELVMRQIESKEILTGEERNQLAELGMPVNEWIAQEMGIEQKEVMDKIEAKEVTSDIWWKAMGKGVEGGAELMGKTFTGAWLNFLAAVKRSGQFFDEPLLEPMRRGLNMMTKLLDDNQEYFTRLGKAASVGMSEAVDTVPKLMAALKPLGPSIIRLVDALAPLLPQLVQGFATWISIMSPLLIALIEFTTILLEITGPLLPVLIPLLFAALTGFKAYSILKSVTGWLAGFYTVNAAGTATMTASTVAMTAMSAAARLLAASILMFPGLWIVAAIILVVGLLGELYDKSEGVRKVFDWLSDSFRNADEWLNNLGSSIDGFFEKHFPKLAKLNDALAAPLNWINDKLSGVGNSVGKGTGTHEALGTGEWAGSGQGMLRFTHGSGSLDENGNPIGRGAAENDRREKGIAPIEYATDGPNAVEQVGSLMNPEVAPAEQYTDRAAPEETSSVFDFRNGGLPPVSWNVENNPEENPAPDAAFQDAMDRAMGVTEEGLTREQLQERGVGGLADGGWTGPGSINVGERGREFVTSAWAANQVETNAPGAMQFINDTGQLPPTSGVQVNAEVNISGVNDPEQIRAIVMAAIRDAALEAERGYMNTPVRGAG